MKSSSHSDPPSLPPSAREEKLIHLLEQALERDAARGAQLRELHRHMADLQNALKQPRLPSPQKARAMPAAVSSAAQNLLGSPPQLSGPAIFPLSRTIRCCVACCDCAWVELIILLLVACINIGIIGTFSGGALLHPRIVTDPAFYQERLRTQDLGGAVLSRKQWLQRMAADSYWRDGRVLYSEANTSSSNSTDSGSDPCSDAVEDAVRPVDIAGAAVASVFVLAIFVWRLSMLLFNTCAVACITGRWSTSLWAAIGVWCQGVLLFSNLTLLCWAINPYHATTPSLAQFESFPLDCESATGPIYRFLIVGWFQAVFDMTMLSIGIGFVERIPLTWEASVVSWLDAVLLAFLGFQLILGMSVLSLYGEAADQVVGVLEDTAGPAIANAFGAYNDGAPLHPHLLSSPPLLTSSPHLLSSLLSSRLIGVAINDSLRGRGGGSNDEGAAGSQLAPTATRGRARAATHVQSRAHKARGMPTSSSIDYGWKPLVARGRPSSMEA